MLNLGLGSKFWGLLLVQVPFLICATWVLPREWKKIKAAFTEKIYRQIWLVVLFNFALTLLVSLFNLLGTELIPQQVTTFSKMGPLAAFFITCLVAPIAEECFFRYLIFANFAKNNILLYLVSFFGFILGHAVWIID